MRKSHRTGGVKRAVAAVTVAVLTVLAASADPVRAENPPQRVLVLHSYHHGMEWCDDIQQGVEDGLKEGGASATLTVEYLDAARLAASGVGKEISRALADYLGRRLRSFPYGAVVCSDDPALEFLLANREAIAPGLPVVFCGVNDFQPEMLDGHKDITGVSEAPSFQETLEVGLRLFPGADKLLVLGDDSLTFSRNKAALERALPGLSRQLSVEILSPPRMDVIEARLRTLGRDWLVLPLARPVQDNALVPLAEAGRRISAASSVPVLACWDFMLKAGALGGKVISAHAQGYEAGRMAAAILRGASAGDIPVRTQSPNRFLYEHAQLLRFSLENDDLPQGATVLNEPASFYQANASLVWTGAAFVCSLVLALVVLAVNVARRERAERRLQAQYAFVQALLEAIPNPVFYKNARGEILGCNAAFARDAGRPKTQIINKNVFDLVSRDKAEVYHQMDQAMLATGEDHSHEDDLPGPDGETRVLLFNKAVYRDDSGKAAGIVGVITDITKAKRAEQALRVSEQRYALVMQGANDGIWDWDLRTGSVYFSPRYKQMLGYSPEEFPDAIEQWRARIHPDDRAMVLEANQACIDGRAPSFAVEYRLRHRDGGYRWVLGRGAALKDETGAVIRLAGAHMDLTARRDAQEKLHQALAFNEMILDHSPVGVGVFEAENGRCLLANAVLSGMAGMRSQDMLGRSYHDAGVCPSPALGEMAGAALAGQGVQRRDISLLKAGGELLVTDCLMVKFDVEDRPHLLLIASDITERARMQEAMIQSEKMMSVGGLAAGMAHEINNPLSGILQCTQVVRNRLLGDTPLARERAQAAGCPLEGVHRFAAAGDIPALLDAMRDSAARAAKIVSNMLDFSRRVEKDKVPFDLHVIVDAALELCASDYDLKKKYDFRRIRIERQFDPDLPQVPCTPTQIEQVVMNLLRNAAQAMAGSPDPVLCLRIRQEGDHAVLEVEDNGPGMEESVRRRAFEPFFTTKKPGEGTGLGLSVSYYIVATNHDGGMEVFSRSGQGTRFVIRLPLAQPVQAS